MLRTIPLTPLPEGEGARGFPRRIAAHVVGAALVLLALAALHACGDDDSRAAPPPSSTQSGFVDKQAFGGKATLKEVTIAFGPPETPRLHLLLVVPNHRKAAARPGEQ